MATLYSFSPNTQIESSKVNSNFTALNNEIADIAPSFIFHIKGTLLVQTGAQRIIAPKDYTCQKLWYKTTSGTCTIRVKETSETLIESVAVTSSVTSSTSFTQTDIEAGDEVILDITASSSGVDLWVTLQCVYTL